MQNRLGAPKPHLVSGDGTKAHPTLEWDITPTIHHILVPVQSPSQCPIPSICPWDIAPKHKGKC